MLEKGFILLLSYFWLQVVFLTDGFFSKWVSRLLFITTSILYISLYYHVTNWKIIDINILFAICGIIMGIVFYILIGAENSKRISDQKRKGE